MRSVQEQKVRPPDPDFDTVSTKIAGIGLREKELISFSQAQVQQIATMRELCQAWRCHVMFLCGARKS